MSEKIVVLTVKSQKSSGEKVFRLHKKRVVLGSATSSDVRLDDASVAPVHAILEVSGIDGKPVVYDLASETGLQINGKPTIQATLESSDKLQIGPYLVTVRIQQLSEVPQKPQFVKESFGQKLFVSEKEDLAPLILEDERQVIDIFDRRPETKQSLQVVMFYKDTILEVEHFVNRKRIVIGPGTKEDFAIPPFLGQGRGGRFELVTREGGQYQLHLHDSMQGVVSQNGKVLPVQDVMASLSAKVYPLNDKDFAKVKLNDVSFFLNFTPAPPKLKTPRLFDRDPLFLKIWILSLALTLALVIGLGSMEVNPTIEVEQLPERVATIIYEPKLLPVERPPVPKVKEEPKPTPPPKVVEAKPTPKPKPQVIKVEPKPEPVKPAPKKSEIAQEKPTPAKPVAAKPTPPKPQAKPQPVQKPQQVAKRASGNEGEGAKAKGPEGSRGKPNAPKGDTPQTKAQRPGEGKRAQTVSLNKGNSQAQGMGVVDVFKSNQGTLNKLLAGGQGGSSAAAKLEGYSGFTTKGEGGLGEAGSGSGGGGKSLGLGGLSDKGAGGGKRGTGLGALGNGSNMLGGKGRIAINSGGSMEPVVFGAIDNDAIRREIEKHRDEIKYCYEKEINADRPDLAGRVVIRFVIGSSGVVSSSGVANTSLKNANTESCVVDVIRRIVFPPVRGGGTADVTYPFVFKPSNK